MNERAWAMVDGYLARSEELGVRAHMLASGARVVDAGIQSPGGLEAGRAMAEVCMGGLGSLEFTNVTIGDDWQAVRVWTDHPAEACMASQYAGWAIDPEGYFAMGSGPLRAHARVEHELFGKLGYAEDAARGVLVLEGRTPPDDGVAAWVAAKARLTPDARDDLRAVGRTNDCILYGGQARYVVRADDDELAQLAERLPASASGDCERMADALNAVREMGDVIIKPIFGSLGHGMVRVSDPDVALRVLQALDEVRAVFYVQRAIDHGGRDVRVFVVGGRVIGAIERVAPEGEWRTNVARGARTRVCDLPAEWADLALRAAAAVSADYAGIDLLPARVRTTRLHPVGRTLSGPPQPEELRI